MLYLMYRLPGVIAKYWKTILVIAVGLVVGTMLLTLLLALMGV
jgi:hypothetical protein